MKVATWNNGNYNKSGSGYGIRISRKDRDKYFNKTCEFITLEIEDSTVEIKIRETFWTTCPELRSKEIGKFLIKYGYSEWSKGKPFNLELELLSKCLFRLSK